MKTTLMKAMLIAGILAFSNDVWADDLYLSGALDGTYYSSDGIVAEGTAQVETGKDVRLYAIDRIELRPGFRVNAGAAFRANLESDADTDADGLLDWWELHFLGSLQWGQNDDPDRDGLTNFQEYGAMSDPDNTDADRDGLLDGWEIENFGNFAQGRNGDPDGDGFSNIMEQKAGTNPNSVNSTPSPGYLCEYDDQGRLKSFVYITADHRGHEIAYAYEANGNRIQKTVTMEGP